jgi:O-antigen/teichoic acid export membrane protein
MSGRRLTRNTVLNVLGYTAPLLVAVFVLPLFIKGLGTDRFGAFMVIWGILSYCNYFDFGLGRALTKLVAEKLGSGQTKDISGLVWTAFALNWALGMIGAVLMALISPWLVYSLLHIPESLQAEMLAGCYLVAVSIPAVVHTVVLRGVLEAYQRFDLTNAVRIPSGLFSFLGPLVVLSFSDNLSWIVFALMIGKVMEWITHLWLCFRVVPALRRLVWTLSFVRPLVSFGSWMTVVNVISPVMQYLDRFVIGMVASMAAVAYYTTPYEVVTKLILLPVAFVGVLFPAFSTSLVQERGRAVMLFDRGLGYSYLILFPVILIMVALAGEGLRFWVGREFAFNSTRVVQWLAVGVLINGLAQIPFAFIQANGRPELIAKLHLAELPPYLLCLWWLLSRYGIEGAAVSWTLRVLVDAVLLLTISWRLVPETVTSVRRIVALMGGALLFLGLCAFTADLLQKMVMLFFALAAFVLASWYLILQPQERSFIKGKLGMVKI